MNESRRMRVSSALLLIALSLITFASVQESGDTRHAVLAIAGVGLAISTWLFLTDRGETEEPTGPSLRLRIGVLATTSVGAAAALGVTVAKDMWVPAGAALVAVAIVTHAIWRLIRETHRQD